jgi:TolB-like protein
VKALSAFLSVGLCFAALGQASQPQAAAPDAAQGSPQDTPPRANVLRVAVLNFEGTSSQDRSGVEVADAVVAHLASDPSIVVVEREQLLRLLDEQKVGLSALVGPREVVRVGRLVSAQLVVTGRVSSRDNTNRVVARVISTETSRLLAVSAEAPAEQPLSKLAEVVAKRVGARIKESGRDLTGADDGPDAIAPYVEKLRGRKLPVVHVRIPEQHVGRAVPDPAAETEILLSLQRVGVPILDPAADNPEGKAELLVTGEGVSSFAVRTGDLITCVARLEWKGRTRGSERIDLVGRHTARRADLAEPIAAKLALEDTGRAAALDIIAYLERTTAPAAPAKP